MISLQRLLDATVKKQASDLHIVSDAPPALRVNGQIIRIKMDALKKEEVEELCYSILTEEQKSRLEENKELDASFNFESIARFRANFFYQKGCLSAAFRYITNEIPEIEELGLPSIVNKLADFPTGLVLVVGPTGSGKSTTLASLINKINRERKGHIITIEDPIEYLHEHQASIVNQREVGYDTYDFKKALKSLLRQDPDVCLIGELRDRETIETALTVAETGHLVFSTLHTNSAIQTINRILATFPKDQQDHIRSQLSLSLRAVVSQRLLINKGRSGRELASEVLMMTPNIQNLVRENKLHQVYGMMQVGQDKTGMVTLNQSLFNLVLRRKVDLQEAFTASPDPEELNALMNKSGF